MGRRERRLLAGERSDGAERLQGGHTDTHTDSHSLTDNLPRISLASPSHLPRFSLASPLQVLEGHTDEIFSAAFNYEGDTVITGSKDNTCRIWKC